MILMTYIVFVEYLPFRVECVSLFTRYDKVASIVYCLCVECVVFIFNKMLFFSET